MTYLAQFSGKVEQNSRRLHPGQSPLGRVAAEQPAALPALEPGIRARLTESGSYSPKRSEVGNSTGFNSVC